MKKKELNQEDESLIETGEVNPENQGPDAIDFIQKNGKIIIGLSVIIILAIALAFYMRSKSESDSQRAAVLLTRVGSYYEAADYDKALNGDPDRKYGNESVKGLKYIADEFGGTDQGKIAALYTGNIYLTTNKPNEAQKYFEIASGSDSEIIKLGANAGLGSVLELQGKYKEAAESYLQSAQMTEEDNIKSRYMYYAGLCYEKIGDKKQAETIYKDIIKINEFAEFSVMAKTGLSRIGTIIE